MARGLGGPTGRAPRGEQALTTSTKTDRILNPQAWSSAEAERKRTAEWFCESPDHFALDEALGHLRGLFAALDKAAREARPKDRSVYSSPLLLPD